VKQLITKADRACGIAAASMAHDLNSEFTVILSSVSSAIMTLEPDHPARPALDELISALQRCTYKCSDLLVFTSRHGVQPARVPLAAIMEL
jgi:hypothetical protein